jgi:GT2 family glycosyltransferase
MITRDRREGVLATLPHLLALPERPRIVLVDNGSSDGTAAVVRQRFPSVDVISLPENLGAAARTHGVRRVDAPYVAFADDDSWWEPGALTRAADLLDAHPVLGLVAAKVLVGESGEPDRTCEQMAASPLTGESWLPGPPVLGFIACGAVVRRSAYLDAGGFHPDFGVGGEEEVFALDLASAGWSLVYVDDVVVHHHPSPVRDRERRRQVIIRNVLWSAWLRRPASSALPITARIAGRSLRDRAVRKGLVAAARGLPWVLRERKPVPPRIEAALRLLDETGRNDGDVTASTNIDVLPSETLDVSVVVPTYRRDDTLLRCLETLARQDFPSDRFEVIVVDDARSATTPRAVGGFASRHSGLDVRVLPGMCQGPAAARNVGWRAARGTVIAFIDDDAYPAGDGWLREGVSSFEDSRIAGVDGPVRVPADDPPTDFQRNVMGLERGTFITCNAFYRRSWLERVGGFDEEFRAPFREDSDLQYRVEAAGGVLVRNPRALVIHPAAPGRFAVSLRLQRYSQYNALMYKKHPARYRRDLEPRPPLHYYAIAGSALVGIGTLLAGRPKIAALPALIWAALSGRFFLRRARGTSHQPRHLADLALTSVVIPWLSIYYRLRGAVRYRVLFI